MTKKEIREKYKTKRSELSAQIIEDKSIQIANNCLQLPIWGKTFFHLFLSIEKQKEIDTRFLLHILSGRDKNIVISKSDFKTYQMSHFLLTDNTKIKINTWGIPEPESGIAITPQQIEVVFIPLLAFDEKGNRAGYGKGFYDRFLAQCPENTIKVGLSFYKPEKQIETDKNDIPLDYCVTPEKTYSF